MNALEGKSADANSVLALADRVTAVETTARRTMNEQSANIALLMSLSQLRDALATGRSFTLELETAKALAARSGIALDDSAFAAAATRGIPSLPELRRRFRPTAAAVMRASAMPDGASAWYRRIFDRAMSIVAVRRLDGDAAGTSTSAVLARAEQRVNEGDVAAAVSEMDGLRGGAATAAAAWLADAHLRVAAERAGAEVTTRAIAALNAAAKETPSADGQ